MKNTLAVVYRKTADLIPYVNNARTHSDEQITQIASSIKEFGFNNPILIDGENGVIAGHGRLMAAKKLGLDQVPTIELTGMTEAQKKAYILADNKIALNSGWDYDLLKIEISELPKNIFELTGFTENELENLYESEFGEDADDLEFLDDYSDSYNITIVCESLSEAEKLNEKLGLNLDLTRRILKRKFKEVSL